jgi:predicted ATPase/DNA-binding CsgD family transcriptional regulator
MDANVSAPLHRPTLRSARKRPVVRKRAAPSPLRAALAARSHPGQGPLAATPEEISHKIANLHQALPPLIGRDNEIASIVALLQREEVRLVTLTGPGGVGKTRVALAVAAEMAANGPTHVNVVELATVRDPDMVLPAIADALGLVLGQWSEPVEQLAHALRADQRLLVLDNVEQVADASLMLAGLLVRCPGLKLLVTSRVVLHLALEHDVIIAPLSNPDAVTLFVSRAQQTAPNREISGENTATLEAICERLDGLPLAIELAAARMGALPVGALLDRLDRALPLLTVGPRDQPERQRTMRTAIGWSHDLLSEVEKALFRRLAVFEGGFTLDAIDAVAIDPTGRSDSQPGMAGNLPISSLDGVSSLIDKSLVVQVSSPREREPRYRMLETIREFGLEQLAASGEEHTIRTAHAIWAGDLAAALRPRLFTDACALVLVQLDREHDNMRAALRWTEASNSDDLALRLLRELGTFWIFRGHYREGRWWLDRWLQHIPPDDPAERASQLARNGWLTILHGDVESAREKLEEAITSARAAEAHFPGASAMLAMGFVQIQRGDYDATRFWTSQALEAFRRLESTASDARHFTSLALAHLAQIFLLSGDTQQAGTYVLQATNLQRELGFRWGLGDSLRLLGHVARRQGDHDQARHHYRESLELASELGDPRMISESLAGVAGLVAERGAYERAARLYGSVATIRKYFGTLSSGWDPAEYEQRVALVRKALSPETFQQCWRAGERLSWPESIAEAITVCVAMGDPTASLDPADPPADFSFTPREAEVLTLLAQGMTDRQIADALSVSPRTVGGYVTKLLTRLNLESRTAAAVFAVRHGLG